MGASMLWLLCGVVLAAAQDPGLYSGGGGLQFLPGPGQDAGLPLLQYPGAVDPNSFLLGGGYQPAAPAPAPAPADQRTGPLTFGPEHARPTATTPNPFRQGPLVQAALQQQRVLQQLQQQQQAFAAAPASPSSRYASLPQPPQPPPAPAAVGPSGFAGYSDGYAPSAPSAPGGSLGLLPAPGPGQDGGSSYSYTQ